MYVCRNPNRNPQCTRKATVVAASTVVDVASIDIDDMAVWEPFRMFVLMKEVNTRRNQLQKRNGGRHGCLEYVNVVPKFVGVQLARANLERVFCGCSRPALSWTRTRCCSQGFGEKKVVWLQPNVGKAMRHVRFLSHVDGAPLAHMRTVGLA